MWGVLQTIYNVDCTREAHMESLKSQGSLGLAYGFPTSIGQMSSVPWGWAPLSPVSLSLQFSLLPAHAMAPSLHFYGPPPDISRFFFHHFPLSPSTFLNLPGPGPTAPGLHSPGLLELLSSETTGVTPLPHASPLQYKFSLICLGELCAKDRSYVCGCC